jgi:hypothetical protein
MRTSNKIGIAAGVLAVAVIGGAAFTGTGLSSSLATSQFIGGSVSQTINGASLTAIDYHWVDDSHTALDAVKFTFDSQAEGKTVTVDVASSSGASFTCPDVASGTFDTTCVPATVPATGVTGVTVTVA